MRSLTCIKKSISPITDPCGTPNSILDGLKKGGSTKITRPDEYDRNQAKVLPRIPIRDSFQRSILFVIELNAFRTWGKEQQVSDEKEMHVNNSRDSHMHVQLNGMP